MKALSDVLCPDIVVQSPEINDVPRGEIVDSLMDYGLSTEAVNFDECHTRMRTYICSKCGYTHFFPYRCKLRICPDCGKTRHGMYVMKLNHMLKEKVETSPKPYRLKLYACTYPKLDVDEWGPEIYSFLLKSHTRFLKHKLIRSKLNGGVGGALACMETKYSEKGDFYFKKRSPGTMYEYTETGVHVHIHGIMLSKFINQKWRREVNQAWKAATKNKASIGDIREVDNVIMAISEATKYIFKPSKLGPAENYARYLTYTSNRNLYNRYGSFRGFDLGKKSNVSLVCRFCSNDLEGGDEVHRRDAVDMYEEQSIPRGSLLSFTLDRKPILPGFKFNAA